MTRIHLASLLALVIVVPAAAAATFLTSRAGPQQPCFIAGDAAYRMSDSASANYTVRIDNAAASASLRLQLVDDPTAADFVLVDENDGVEACKDAETATSIRLDPTAKAPDLTVALSRTPADTKIYVKSASFSAQDAAALFAVVRINSRRARLAGRDAAARR